MFRIQFISLEPIERIMTLLFASGWGLLLAYEWHNPFFTNDFAIIPILIVVSVLLLTACCGVSKLSAMAGKGFVVIGIMGLLFGFFATESISVHLPEFTWLMVVLSGLWVERISPHQQFYTWMFLAIATKIEFVLVSGLIVQLSGNLVGNYIPVNFWWILVPLMGLSVPLAAGKLEKLYKLLVFITTVVAFVLVVDIIAVSSELPLASNALAIAVLAWPVLADRWVGRLIFRH